MRAADIYYAKSLSDLVDDCRRKYESNRSKQAPLKILGEAVIRSGQSRRPYLHVSGIVDCLAPSYMIVLFPVPAIQCTQASLAFRYLIICGGRHTIASKPKKGRSRTSIPLHILLLFEQPIPSPDHQSGQNPVVVTTIIDIGHPVKYSFSLLFWINRSV